MSSSSIVEPAPASPPHFKQAVEADITLYWYQSVNIDWSREFDRQLDQFETEKSERGQRVYRLLTIMLKQLRDLEVAPTEDTAMIKRVRQSRVHRVWRISHPYREGIALRLIVWFPPVDGRVVVALFAGRSDYRTLA